MNVLINNSYYWRQGAINCPSDALLEERMCRRTQ